MSRIGLDMSAVGSPSDYYPDDRVAAHIEQEIARELPVVQGLDEASTLEQRVALMSVTAAQQRARFIAAYGDEFGCVQDVASVPPVRPVKLVQYAPSFVGSRPAALA